MQKKKLLPTTYYSKISVKEDRSPNLPREERKIKILRCL